MTFLDKYARICLVFGGGTVYKVHSYPIDKLYSGISNGKNIVVFVPNLEGENLIRPLTINEYDIVNVDNIEIVEPFIETLKKADLDVFLTDQNGLQKKEISVQQIVDLNKVLYRKRTLDEHYAKRNHLLSNNVACVVSDLLGLNVASNPSTMFGFDKIMPINEIIVSAQKLQNFKTYLINYLEVGFLTEGSVIVTKEGDICDYRVLRALKKSKIKKTEELKANDFAVTAKGTGQITVNGLDIKEYSKKQENGFQKVIHF